MAWQPNREELAWAAGFFDGEGSLSCSGGKRAGHLRVDVSQIEPTTLRRFQAAIGGLGNVYGPWQRSRPERPCQPIYKFQIGSSSGTFSMIALLWQFLSEPKRVQIKKAVEAFKLRRQSIHAVLGRYSKSRKHYSPQQVLERLRNSLAQQRRHVSREAIFRRYFGTFQEAKRQAMM